MRRLGWDGTATSPLIETASAEPKGELTIGVSGAFLENQLVAEMYAQVLENAGYTITRELNLENREIGDQALEHQGHRPQARVHGLRAGFWDPKATTNGSPDEVVGARRGGCGTGVRDLRDLARQQHERLRDPARHGRGPGGHGPVERRAGLRRAHAWRACGLPRPAVLPARPEEGLRHRVRGGAPARSRREEDQLDSGAVDIAEFFSDPTITDKGYVVLTDDQNLQANGNFVPLGREDVASEELGALLDSVTTTCSPTRTCAKWPDRLRTSNATWATLRWST